MVDFKMAEKAFELRIFGGVPCGACIGVGYVNVDTECDVCKGSGIKPGTQKRRPEDVKRFSF